MKKILFFIVPMALFACSKPVPDNHEKLEQLADRTCRAIDYRKERFACADQIRFAQDTLGQAKNKVDSDRLNKRLEVLLKEKTVILNKSLALADTIKRQLDSLMPFTDKVAQKRFTAQLDSLLTKKGCNDETKGPSSDQ